MQSCFSRSIESSQESAWLSVGSKMKNRQVVFSKLCLHRDRSVVRHRPNEGRIDVFIPRPPDTSLFQRIDGEQTRSSSSNSRSVVKLRLFDVKDRLNCQSASRLQGFVTDRGPGKVTPNHFLVNLGANEQQKQLRKLEQLHKTPCGVKLPFTNIDNVMKSLAKSSTQKRLTKTPLLCRR